MNKKNVFRFNVVCMNENCDDIKIKVTMESDGKELSSILIDWDELDNMLDALTYFKNINKMLYYSNNLKKMKPSSEAESIMQEWTSDEKEPISYTEWHINRDEMAQDVRNADAHKKDLAD